MVFPSVHDLGVLPQELQNRQRAVQEPSSYFGGGIVILFKKDVAKRLFHDTGPMVCE